MILQRLDKVGGGAVDWADVFDSVLLQPIYALHIVKISLQMWHELFV